MSSHARPPSISAAPAAADTTPSIPFAPRFARKRIGLEIEGKKLSTSRIGIDELTHTVAASGSEVASAAQTLGSSGSSASASAGGTSSSAARQLSIQLGFFGTEIVSARSAQVSAGSAAAIHCALRVGSCQVAWGSSTSCSVRASQARRGFDVGVSPIRTTIRGRCSSAHRSSRSSTS